MPARLDHDVISGHLCECGTDQPRALLRFHRVAALSDHLAGLEHLVPRFRQTDHGEASQAVLAHSALSSAL